MHRPRILATSVGSRSFWTDDAYSKPRLRSPFYSSAGPYSHRLTHAIAKFHVTFIIHVYVGFSSSGHILATEIPYMFRFASFNSRLPAPRDIAATEKLCLTGFVYICIRHGVPWLCVLAIGARLRSSQHSSIGAKSCSHRCFHTCYRFFAFETFAVFT